MSRTPKWDRDARDADGVCRTCGEAGRLTHKAWCVTLEPWTSAELGALRAKDAATFRRQWVTIMYRKVGYQPRAAMPATLTDAQWARQYRTSVRTRTQAPTAFAETHQPRWAEQCHCVDCQRSKWDRAVLAFNRAHGVDDLDDYMAELIRHESAA